MFRARFDKRLILILSIMGCLALTVGIASIAVNRYLVRTHSALIETSLPIFEFASRIGNDADVLSASASDLFQAKTPQKLIEVESAISSAATSINSTFSDLAAMTGQEILQAKKPAIAALARALVSKRRKVLEIEAVVREEQAGLALTGVRLSKAIGDELELARLRITSNISDLYSAEGEIRSRLDTLADRDFFAFERLTEMERAVDTIQLTLQQLSNITEPAEMERARTRLSKELWIATRRQAYLPTIRARKEISGLIDRYRTTIEPGGMIDRQIEKMAVIRDIESSGQELQSAVATLSDFVADTRTRVRSAELSQIARAERVSDRLFAMLLGIVVLSSLIGALLWYYARRKLVERLGNVSQQIIAVAQGEYDTSIPITGADEIGRMEKALNVLRRQAREATRLRESLEQQVLKRTGDVVVQMEISDAARAEAERASADKTEFLARMSHEIRTPLTGIIGMLDLMRMEGTDKERQARNRTALQSARELLAIANDILDYASGDDQANRGNPVHFRLRDLVGQLRHQLTSLAEPAGLETSVDLAEDAPQVLFGDVVKIRQIVGNLLSNAVKYTPRGTVTLDVDHAFDPDTNMLAISFSVSDTGTGMTPEAVAHAFEPYSRADAVRRTGTEGVGLGLAISRNLTEALGGSLNVESAPGIGSRFTLTLPLKLGVDEEISKQEYELPRADHGQTVLVIDDHSVNRIVARGYLERLGCKVFEAKNGVEGLSVLQDEAVDLVLIDHDLPDTTGAKLARRIADKHPKARLVSLTAHRVEDGQANREKFGVSRILTKPISPLALVEMMDLETTEENALSQPNTKLLESLKQDVADLGPELTTQIVGEFLGGLFVAVDEIYDAESQDRGKLAHRLKGAASNFHLLEFCEILERIEEGQSSDAEALRLAACEAERQLREAVSRLELKIAPGSTKR